MNQELRLYQLKIVFSPLLEKEKIREIFEGLKKKIEQNNGAITKEIPSLESENRKTRFFYPIKKFLEGYYQTIVFSTSPDSISQIDNYLHLQKSGVLRFMLTSKKAEKAKPFKEDFGSEMIDKIEPLKETLEETKPKEETKTEKKPRVKREKVKLEELDKKLKEILDQ